MSVIARAAAQVKSLVLPGQGGSGLVRWSWSSMQTGVSGERGYSEAIGDGTGSSLFQACVGIIAAAFPEAPVIVRTVPADGSVPEIIPDHSMLRLMRYPLWDARIRRSWYSPSVLWAAVLYSYWADGNAYEVKVRNALNKPVQRWYVPHWMLEPKWPADGRQFISHYEYSPDGRDPVRIDVQDVVHYRMGIDPNNIRKGWSPVKTVLREIYTDEEAARFSAAILRNLGVPGLMLSPAKDSKRALTPTEAKEVKADVEQKTTGDRRGETLVFTNPTELKTFGFSPDDLNLGSIRDVPEERVAAVMRVPAAIAGFGAGLEGVKVGATMAQLREQLWDANLLPTMRTFAEELQGQMLPDFATDQELDRQQVAFDLRDVGALQDREMAKAKRVTSLTDAQILRRKEGRAALGYPWGPDDDVYLGRGLTPTATGGGAGGDQPADPLVALQASIDAGLASTGKEVATLRHELAIAMSKMPDNRPDPNMLRLVEGMEFKSSGRDATLIQGFVELASALRSQPPSPPAPPVIRTEMQVERDENGRVTRSVTVAVPDKGGN